MERNKPCFCGSGLKQKRCHSDIESNSMFADLIKFYTELDYRLNSVSNPMNCFKGCCECCYQIFEISNLEFAYMCYGYAKSNSLNELFREGNKIYNLMRENNPAVIDLLKKQEKASSLEELSNISVDIFYNVNNLKYKCPFLNIADGCCSVYDYRPFVCRKHGVGYIDDGELPPVFKPCSKNSSHISKNDLVYVGDFASNNMVLSIFDDNCSNTTIVDQMFPIFYFCHLGFKGLDDYLKKITLFSKYSRENYMNLIKRTLPYYKGNLARKN